MWCAQPGDSDRTVLEYLLRVMVRLLLLLLPLPGFEILEVVGLVTASEYSARR